MAAAYQVSPAAQWEVMQGLAGLVALGGSLVRLLAGLSPRQRHRLADRVLSSIQVDLAGQVVADREVAQTLGTAEAVERHNLTARQLAAVGLVRDILQDRARR